MFVCERLSSVNAEHGLGGLQRLEKPADSDCFHVFGSSRAAKEVTFFAPLVAHRASQIACFGGNEGHGTRKTHPEGTAAHGTLELTLPQLLASAVSPQHPPKVQIVVRRVVNALVSHGAQYMSTRCRKSKCGHSMHLLSTREKCAPKQQGSEAVLEHPPQR